MNLKVKCGNTANKRTLPRYFPLILLGACIALECIFQVLPLFGWFRLIPLLYIWPFGLLIWLVYWVRIHPKAILNFSYLVLVNVFFIFAYAVITPKISRLLGKPSLTDHVAFVLPIVFIVLLIIQLVAKEIVKSKERL
ncbi:MAG: hypothetical protein GWN67_28375 [Phycisphaerae bacterium]|nr:hypothetical protein [Phycisphaerae bacterium]NIR65046.1 hypothetical protein [candidate division Zixibacteria bacterium]NIP56228.1 hypothetical protein [Phycisphaerae bacterium]NIS54682.1 hypothetical protein [Phycisphaerae bacterium]NIU12273.1 hypothetical protein [Phycisphaerae bacterium]